MPRPGSVACLAVTFAVVLAVAAPPAPAAPKPASVRLPGETVARVAITLAERDGAALVPGPFAVLPGGRRVALALAEADGILLLEGDRIVHHFPLPGDAHEFDDMAASPALLVAGRRMLGASAFVDLFVYDLQSGREVERVQSANPYLRPPADGRDRWRIVLEGTLLGAFDPSMAATYPLWDAKAGVIAGGEQVVRSTSGVGFDDAAVWVPNPDGSVNRKGRGVSEPFAAPGAGEFVGGLGDSVVVVLADDDPAAPERRLPRELVVRVQEADTIRELRLPAVDGAVKEDVRIVPGRPVRMLGGRLYWCYLGPDYLEIRAAAVPAARD